MVLSHYKIWASHSKVFCPFHGNKRSMAGHQWIGIPGPISVQVALPVTPFLSLLFCSLGFSVTIFCTEAMIAIGILLLRRNQSVSGGELGGPKCIKTITSLIFMSLWFVYIGLSAMEAYGVITPGFWISQPPPLSPLQSASSSQLPPGVPVSTSTTKTTSQLQPCLKMFFVLYKT